MQPAVIQNIPLAFLAWTIGSSAVHRETIATGSCASVEWQVDAGVPTQAFSPEHAGDPSLDEARSALALVALAGAMVPGSRPLADWERRDADEFFWSQFE